ncbi:MAG: topoisomerase DNA-binding C4 zinc finger domain-containing protein [Deltaproteobacteria bacterium]|nr:topoisomerase DNA-binding C4 zinc finger domain-containing protein [Deltaproteobacteria bacterium]
MATSKAEWLVVLDRALSTERNPEALGSTLRHALEELRGLWRAAPSDFSDADIAHLKGLRSIEQSVAAYESSYEEVSSVDTVDDCEELMGDLAVLLAALAGTAIADRIRRDQRALTERLGKLDAQAADRYETDRVSRVREVERRRAARCPHCQAAMVLRDGTFGLFWGCARFPDCVAKRQVLPEDLAFIERTSRGEGRTE